MVQPLWKTAWKLLKLHIDLPSDSAIPILGRYPREMKTGVQTKTCTGMSTAALFTIGKRWKQPKCPSTDE